MRETGQHPEELSSAQKARAPRFRSLLWLTAAGIVLAMAVLGTLYWRRSITRTSTARPYVLPFHPEVTYDASDVIIRNPEAEPYLDTSIIIYVGGTRYSLQVGTIRPGERIRRSLRSLTNERGEGFKPGSAGTSELEVRARFGGYDVHKDYPPPP